MWTTSPGILRSFKSFLILLNLEKNLLPEQLVTIKLRNKSSRGCINWEPLIQGIRPKRAFVIFCCFPVSLGKSSAGASWQSGFCLLFKLIKIFSDLVNMGAVQTCASRLLNNNPISEWLYWRKLKWKKMTSKNTNRALRDTNADKTTVLLSHLRNNLVMRLL